MAAALPRDVADLHVLTHAKTAYVGAPQADLVNRLSEAAGKSFTAPLGLEVIATTRRMFADPGIVVSFAHDGDHRTFQKQHELRTSSTASSTRPSWRRARDRFRSLAGSGLRHARRGVLAEVVRGWRAGRRSEAPCGAFLVMTWSLPACPLLAHAAVGA